jgi:hypothetical protein
MARKPRYVTLQSVLRSRRNVLSQYMCSLLKRAEEITGSSVFEQTDANKKNPLLQSM